MSNDGQIKLIQKQFLSVFPIREINFKVNKLTLTQLILTHVINFL